MLKHEIVKFFTMNQPSTGSITRGSRLELATDSDGKLFLPAVRKDVSGYSEDGSQTVRTGMEAVIAIRIAAKLIHLNMERWAETQGLSEGRLQVLFILRIHPEGVPLGQLAGMQRVSPRNITGLVDALERDGLVERVPDPLDRRSVTARLTDAGEQRINGIWKQAIDKQLPIVRGFSSEELVELRHLALRLVRNLREEIGDIHQ
jgi:DNA-binding MarR family transcriptional regulator